MLSSFTLDRANEIVDGIPEERRVVLLGESTHGTEVRWKICLFESVSLTLAPSGRYVHVGVL